MTPTRTKKSITAIAGLAMLISLALEAAIPISAQAQSGWRICGHYWKGRNNGAIYAKVMKVRKEDIPACETGWSRTERMRDNNMPPEVANQPWDGPGALKMTCEELGKLLNNKYGSDPCYGMLGVATFGSGRRTPSQFWWSP